MVILKKPYLGCKVEIFLTLNGTHAWLLESINLVHPFGAPSPDVARHNNPKWGTVHLGERLPVHLPCKDDLFILSHFAPRNGDSVVEDVILSVVMGCQ